MEKFKVNQAWASPVPTLEQWLHPTYIILVPSGTMDINALVISGLDPGAVPGGSTTLPSFAEQGAEIGSTNV